MRGILINPRNRLVAEVNGDFSDFEAINDVVQSDTFAIGPDLGPTLTTFVDDEGALKMDQHWFRFLGVSHAIAGNMLILGNKGMDTSVSLDAAITPDRVRALVKWVTPEDAESDFPPVTITTPTGVQTFPVKFRSMPR
ncbi:MAG: hypothetical protein ACTHJR_12260 [Sphingomonas sp.]|uniref:hypothetical protein n=1 Tax=Sphingomonas sp. TaxID=28214 RepID=UPI003F7E1064